MNWELSENEILFLKDTNDVTFKEEKSIDLIAILRIRNESLILKDTLDHLSNFVESICVYDDASTDESLEILKAHDKVKLIISAQNWLGGVENRLLAETRHRGLLLNIARKYLTFEWVLCADADERFVGDIKEFLQSPYANQLQGIRVHLFDAYMTEGDDAPLKNGVPLLNFRKYFGPECREILMLWQDHPGINFVGLDSREPRVEGLVESHFFCQHYGKSLSYDHWEETCNYYVKNFPWETYGKKWAARKGKALHQKSDFGRDLYEWGLTLFRSKVNI